MEAWCSKTKFLSESAVKYEFLNIFFTNSLLLWSFSAVTSYAMMAWRYRRIEIFWSVRISKRQSKERSYLRWKNQLEDESHCPLFLTGGDLRRTWFLRNVTSCIVTQKVFSERPEIITINIIIIYSVVCTCLQHIKWESH